MNQTYSELHQSIAGLPIIDTHEHLPARELARPMGNDVLTEYLSHYFSCDLVSAGLQLDQLAIARDSSKPLMQRWKMIEAFWQAARNTGYGRSLDIAARDLYGLAQVDGSTIEALNDAFAKARAGGKTYQTVLKDKSNIRLSLVDSDLNCDRAFFRSVVRLDDFISVSNRSELEQLARRAGVSTMHSLGDLEEACEKTLNDALAAGAVCLKSALAYQRSLRYEKVSASDAQREFNALFDQRNISPTWYNQRGQTDKLQDYMMHHLCRLADRRGLTFEIHTGIQEGNGNYICHSDPALLSNLFIEYPNIKFDVFHISYPYQQVLTALAKNFRNVFIDFAWAHIVSPTAAVYALVEYLDAVPANKISGFGGDYAFVDGVYGHQVLARRNIATALAIKVDQGDMTMARANRVARMILHDNPIAIFGLQNVLGS